MRNVATGWYAGGDALQAELQEVAKMLGDRVLLDHPVSAAGLADGWVEAGAERFRAKAVLIASGTRPEHLAAAPAGAFGGDVTYEIETDPDRFAGRPVVVIGGGDSATLDALALAPTASSVMLAHRRSGPDRRGTTSSPASGPDKRIEDLPGWEVESLHGDDRLQEVTLVKLATGERRTVPAGGLVVKISRDPDTGPFRGQLDLDRRGFVVDRPRAADILPRRVRGRRRGQRGLLARGERSRPGFARVANDPRLPPEHTMKRACP